MNSNALGSGSFYGWKNVKVVSFFGFICMYALYFLSLCIPLWEKEFGWSHEGMGYANTIFSIIIGLGYMLGGIFVAKYGARRSIVIGSFILMGGFVVLQFQSKIWHLYLGYGVIIGIGGSLASVLALTILIIENSHLPLWLRFSPVLILIKNHISRSDNRYELIAQS